MKRMLLAFLSMTIGICSSAEGVSGLQFDASRGVAGSLTLPWGEVVKYTAYMNLYYVTNVEDSTYQYMNIYVPEGATQTSPIFMPNGVGGYMASPPSRMDAGAASGRALAEGCVVALPGARGRNSTITQGGETFYTGRAPKGLLDLKAAVRFLRHFDKEMLGDAEKIITNGTSAGGAMSSLLGSSGNNPAYESYLKEMGAADERDDVFASVCFCPIVDLDHADMAYEWLYGCTNGKNRTISEAQQTVSEELAALFPDYLASLSLKKADGTLLTEENYLDYVKGFLIASAQEAKDAGADIPDSIGFKFSNGQMFEAPVNGGPGMAGGPDVGRQGMKERPEGMVPGGPEGMPERPEGMPERPEGMAPGGPEGMPGSMGGPEGGRRGGRPGGMPGGMGGQGEYIVDLDMPTYLNYVVSTIALKTPPAFDSQNVAGGKASGENEEFGDETGSSVNFTNFSLAKATGKSDAEVDAQTAELVRIMNPMSMLADEGSTVAKHWYIRHGARDRDTSFPVPINLATKLENLGKDVNFKLPWNRPHSGDYALNELFDWIKEVTK